MVRYNLMIMSGVAMGLCCPFSPRIEVMFLSKPDCFCVRSSVLDAGIVGWGVRGVAASTIPLRTLSACLI